MTNNKRMQKNEIGRRIRENKAGSLKARIAIESDEVWQ